MPRPLKLTPAALTLPLQTGGPLSAQALATAAGVDRSRVSRALSALGPAVIRLGVTRGARYALRRSIFGKRGECRIYRLNPSGSSAHEWAQLTALHGGWHLEWASPGVKPEWAERLHGHDGFCEGLPFFLCDLRLQGFLGRAAARRLPPGAGWPLDPRAWSDDETLTYLLQYGHDLPGNLVLGDDCTTLALTGSSDQAALYSERDKHYPLLASQANAGAAPGSSVEGEQPKFTTWLKNDSGDRIEAVIVKFTDLLSTPSGRRWADLLSAERIAHHVLCFSSIADAESPSPETHTFGNRRFFQISRFDRVGPHGRRGLVSLRALHNAGFTGRDPRDWVSAARGLQEAGWLSAGDLETVRLRHLFGRLVGNTGMHFGNLTFFLEPGLPLKLAPLYDMLPMWWQPRVGQAEPDPEFTPHPPLAHEASLWPEASKLAVVFWSRVAAEAEISEPFRQIAARACDTLRAMQTRFG